MVIEDGSSDVVGELTERTTRRQCCDVDGVQQRVITSELSRLTD